MGLTVSHYASVRHSKRAPTHPRVRVHYGSVPSRRDTSGAGHTPQATPSRRGTRPTSQVEESTPCVCISISLSNPNHTTTSLFEEHARVPNHQDSYTYDSHNWVVRTYRTSTRLSIWPSWHVLGYDTSSEQYSNHQVYLSGSPTCPHLLSTTSRVAN